MTTTRHDPRVLAAIERGTVQIKLTCVEVALMQLEQIFAHEPQAVAHFAKIRRWLMGCWTTTGAPPQRLIDGEWRPVGRGKPLSAAVQRRADTESETVDDYGKPGGPWDVPSEPGTWLQMAKEALGVE